MPISTAKCKKKQGLRIHWQKISTANLKNSTDVSKPCERFSNYEFSSREPLTSEYPQFTSFSAGSQMESVTNFPNCFGNRSFNKVFGSHFWPPRNPSLVICIHGYIYFHQTGPVFAHSCHRGCSFISATLRSPGPVGHSHRVKVNNPYV